MLGRIASALTPTPPVGLESRSTSAWKLGQLGELLVGGMLDAIEGIRVLHDRRIPGSRANIDHLVVGPAGVFVIDAKKYTGSVEKRDRGTWFRTDERLYVDGRDRSRLIDGVRSQVQVVNDCLGPVSPPVPVHGVVCFVGAEWPILLRRPLRIRGVTALWPEALGGFVAKPGTLDSAKVSDVTNLLARALQPA